MSKIKESELEKRGGIDLIVAEHFRHFQDLDKKQRSLVTRIFTQFDIFFIVEQIF